MFKKRLHLNPFPREKKLLNYGRGPGHINHSRIRMGLSALNNQRHSYNFIAYLHCTICNTEKEDEYHLFIHCDTCMHKDIRRTMTNELRYIFTNVGLCTHFEHLLFFSKHQLVTVLLWASTKLNIENTKTKCYSPIH